MNVIFFPRNDFPNNVEVCAHRFGKRMTYTVDTDTFRLTRPSYSYVPFTTLAKARGIKVSIFADFSTPIDDPDGIIRNDYLNKDIWIDVYTSAPNIDKKVSSGEPISQEEYLAAYNKYFLPNYFAFTGKKPVALSYAYGNNSFKDYISPQFLGGRMVGMNNHTSYGVGCGTPNDEAYSAEAFRSRRSTINWYTQGKRDGFEEALRNVSQLIDQTMLSGGWVNEFTHWHYYYNEGNERWAEAYLDLLASKNINQEICFSGYGEALSYLVYRQMVTRAVMFSPTQKPDSLTIQLETQNTLGVDPELLQIPISVKFSTAGTPLEGFEIKSSRNLISLGGNRYIVEIPFSSYPKAVIEKK